MRVIYTAAALADLDEILDYLARNYPSITRSFEERLQRVLVRIGDWPQSAESVAERPGVRGVPLVRYPYKIYYRITEEAVEILHIHHTSRRAPWGHKSETDDDGGP